VTDSKKIDGQAELQQRRAVKTLRCSTAREAKVSNAINCKHKCTRYRECNTTATPVTLASSINSYCTFGRNSPCISRFLLISLAKSQDVGYRCIGRRRRRCLGYMLNSVVHHLTISSIVRMDDNTDFTTVTESPEAIKVRSCTTVTSDGHVHTGRMNDRKVKTYAQYSSMDTLQ